MKKTNSELMKELKLVQAEINDLVKKELRTSRVTVEQKDLKSETINMLSSYNYEETQENLAKLHEKERHIKFILQKSNIETKVLGYDFTLAEGLLKLAQLSTRKKELEALANVEEITRTSSEYSSKVEYTKTMYSVKKVKEDLRDLETQIYQLQIAIDRTNLTNEIDC